MALFSTSDPKSAYARDPRFATRGNPFMDRYGNMSTFGSVFSTAIPLVTTAVGGIASAVTGIPGLGEAGSELGKGLVSKTLMGAAGEQKGFEDSYDNAQASAAKGMGLAELGSTVGSVGSTAATMAGVGKKAARSTTALAPTPTVATPAVKDVLPPMPASSTGSGSNTMPSRRGMSPGQDQYMLPEFDPTAASLFGGSKPRRTFMFAAGGPTPRQAATPFDGRYVDSVFAANKGLNFVQRYLDPGKYPVIKNPDGTVSTHRMASGDGMVWPTIIQQGSGLVQLGDDEAYNHAMKTGQYINLKDDKAAQWFAENGYKMGTQRSKLYSGPAPAITAPKSSASMFASGGPTPRKRVFGYAYGGMTGRVEAADTIYPESDKTSEDLLMVDKQTGEIYNQMRYDEYILPQIKSLAAGHIMEQDVPDSQKKKALGDMLFGQLKKTPVTGLASGYAGGGPTPKKTPPKAAAFGTGLLDAVFSAATPAAADPARLANLQRQYASATNPTLKARLKAQISSMGAAPASSPSPLSIPGSGAQNQRAAVYRAGSALGMPTSDYGVASVLNGTYRTAPAAATPVAPASAPVKSGRAAARTTSGAKKAASAQTTGLTASQFSKIKASSSVFLPNPAGDLSGLPANPALPTVAPISADRARAGLEMVPSAPATTFAPAVAVAPTPTEKKSKLAALAPAIGDLARIGTGIALGSQKVDMPSIPARWLAYDSEVQQRKNMGLTPEEMAAGRQSIANNYGQGVNSLSMMTGGGASPGVTLAGLTNLGLQRGQQTQNLLTLDAQRRNQNFAQAGAVTGQTTGMEAAIQNEGIQRQAARQAIGTNLIGSTLSNAESRRIFNQNQPIYDRLMESQINSYDQSALTQKAIREAAIKRANELSNS